MIPRDPVQKEVVKVTPTPPQQKATPLRMPPAHEEVDSGPVSPSGKAALSSYQQTERVKVKKRDWRSSIEAYNAL